MKKREVKVENAPPGLSYGVVGRRYFDQEPKDMPQLTKPLGKDTDSTMTEAQSKIKRREKYPILTSKKNRNNFLRWARIVKKQANALTAIGTGKGGMLLGSISGHT